MPLPDPHDGEPTVEVDETLYRSWREAESAAAQWEALAKERKAKLMETIGSAHAGTVNGRTVVTYRPSQKWAEAALRKAFPDLVQHYMKTREVEVFDLETFRQAYPDIVAAFQIRTFRDAS